LGGFSLRAWVSGQHAINLLGKLVERECAGDRDRRLFLSGPTCCSHQNKTGGAMKTPPVCLLAILENGFEILPLVEALIKRRLIQADYLRITFEGSRVYTTSFAEEPIAHRQISTLGSGTARRHSSINADSLVRSRIVSIDKPHFARIDIFGLQARPGLLKELRTVPTRKVRVLNQRDRRVRTPPDSSVVHDRPGASLSQLHEQQQYRRRNCAKEVRAHHVREVPFAFIRSSNPTMRRGQTTVASLNTSANRPPSFGGTNFPHEMPS